MITSTCSLLRHWKKLWGLPCYTFLILLIGFNLSIPTVLAQGTRLIEGTVFDLNGVPIEGASVSVKGGNTAASTKVNGTFSIRVTSGQNTLVISKLGHERVEVNIENQTQIRVSLKNTEFEIEETVVVGYGKQKKETLVGSVSQVSGDRLLQTGGVSNIGSALTGTLPGLTTMSGSGMPGEEAPNIVIRGNNSWNGNSPLILVDGVERPEFFTQMDISSVENISVLKDASATAVFGSRGANGVIIVTTKRGAQGRAEVSGRVNTTMKTASKLPTKFDSYDAIGVRNAAIERELGATPEQWTNYIPESMRLKYRYPANIEEAERYPNIDWEEVLFKDVAMSYNANVGVRGGTNFAKYFANLDFQNEGDLMRNYNNDRGYDPGYNYNRINVRSNLDFQLTSSTVLKVDLGGLYSVRKMPYNQSSDNDAIFWRAAYRNSPDAMMPLYSDGFWGFSGVSGGENAIRALAVGGVRYNTVANITSNFVLEQKLDFLTKGLNFRGMLSLDNRFREIDRGVNDAPSNDAPQKFINPWTGAVRYSKDMDTNGRFDYFDVNQWQTASGTVEAGMRRTYYQFQLNYNTTFAQDHNLSLMGLMSRQQEAFGNEIPRYREDWVFRSTYNYKGKYLIEYNGAYNGSEKFSPENRFAFFSSGGLGYMLSEENFLKNIKFLDQLKLKASYGEVGDDSYNSRFLFQDLWTYGGTSKMGNVGEGSEDSPYTWYRQEQVGNPNVRWETVYKYNAGLEFSILQNLFSGEFNLFRDRRVDIMIGGGRAIPSYFGAGVPPANLGKVNTQGYELELHFKRNLNDNLQVWADFAVTHARSKVLFQDDPELREYYQRNAGFPLYQTRSYISNGYATNWDEVIGSTGHNQAESKRIPGDYIIMDFNGDGIIDNFDSAPYGYSSTPENTYNTNVGAEWKGLSLFLQFYGVNNVTRYVGFESLIRQQNIVYDEGTYWSQDNLDPDSPFPRWSDRTGYLAGSRYQYDGSYIRLKNAELAYRFQPSILRRFGVTSLRVFANGNNLWLWTRMPDDRESNIGGGGGDGAYPTMRRYNIGLNVTF